MSYFDQKYPGQTSLSGACCDGCASGAKACGDSPAMPSSSQMAISTATWAGIYYVLGQKYPKMHWYQKLLIAGAGGTIAANLIGKS